MRPAIHQPFSDKRSTLLSRRAVALALAGVLHVVAFLLVLRPSPPHLSDAGLQPIVVELLPDISDAPTTARKAVEAEPEVERPRSPEPPVEAKAAPLPEESSIWSQVIPLTREEFAAADIGKMPSRRPEETAGRNDGASEGAESGATGPNGERLYRADWHRRPTQAELSYYLPAGGPRVGWGMIACQTIEDYRVDDCREIGQSPAGSGFARAVLQAAWQFRVRPPRIGGRPLVGAWVSIRIEYSEEGAR